MKILYHHRIASKDGQYVHIDEIVNALIELGHEIIMVEPNSIKDTQFGKSSIIVSKLRALLPGFIHEWMEFFYSIYDFIKLCKTIIETKPDCIYERYNLFLPSGIWAKKIFNLPLILEVNSPLFNERDENEGVSSKNLALWTENFVWRSADYVLPVTAVLAEIIKSRNVSENKIHVIPNGINKVKFFCQTIDNNAVKNKFNLQNKLILGFTGFVREWHRLDIVIDAIKVHENENWHLLLVGDGPVRASLEEQAKKLDIIDRITFTGLISRDQMPEYVAAFDIALQPEVVPYASPLKLFEYMALGKAILAPDRPNIKEILTDKENSLLFLPEKEGDFLGKLELLAQSSDLQKKLGLAAMEAVSNKGLYWQENSKKIINLFSELKK